MVETLEQKYPQYQFSYGKTEKGIFELKVFLDITVEHIESQPGNEYSAIVYSFPEGRKVQIAGTKLNSLDIKDNVAGILSIRNGSHN